MWLFSLPVLTSRADSAVSHFRVDNECYECRVRIQTSLGCAGMGRKWHNGASTCHVDSWRSAYARLSAGSARVRVPPDLALFRRGAVPLLIGLAEQLPWSASSLLG